MVIQNLQPGIVSQQSYLHVTAERSDRLTIKVFNAQGRLAKTYNTIVSPGMQQFLIETEDLPMGNYVLNVFCKDTFLKSIRFIKQ